MSAFVSHGLHSLICVALFLERMHHYANLLVLPVWNSENQAGSPDVPVARRGGTLRMLLDEAEGGKSLGLSWEQPPD